MTGKRSRSPRLMCVLVAATVAACLIGGCEQRVVRTRNSFIDPPARPQHNDSARRRHEKSFLDEIGGLLFGWTKHLGDDKPKKSRVTPAPSPLTSTPRTGGP